MGHSHRCPNSFLKPGDNGHYFALLVQNWDTKIHACVGVCVCVCFCRSGCVAVGWKTSPAPG